MPYYPKSQIKTNLYTNGNEYFLSTTQQAYSGYYYELSNGDKFTGKTPEDKENILLKNINPNLDSPFISDLTQKEKIKVDVIFDIINPGYFPPNPPQNRAIPSSNLTIPTQKDYNLGEFQRYFAKKRTENLYLEISKETHDLLKNTDSKIAWDIYTTISLPWDLSGDQTQTYTTNKNTVILIENREKWYGFEVWFKDDFLKYYKTSTIQEDLFTDGTEFINRRTKLTYKGPYHIHPEKDLWLELNIFNVNMII